MMSEEWGEWSEESGVRRVESGILDTPRVSMPASDGADAGVSLKLDRKLYQIFFSSVLCTVTLPTPRFSMVYLPRLAGMTTMSRLFMM